MTFYALGVNHDCASMQQTEAFALGGEAIEGLYEDLILSSESELVLLSTCNRTEAYLYGRKADVERVQAAMSEVAGRAWPDDDSFCVKNESAVQHVLEVTAGIHSMVVGDEQILAQVKEAYQRAVDAGMVHSLMHRLLHTAFRAAKRVSTETVLSEGAASVPTASVEMARQYVEDAVPTRSLSDLRVLLVGAGKTGRLALQAMKSESPDSVAVTNRSPDRAHRAAEIHGGTVVPWENRHDAVLRSDLTLVATGAPDPVIRLEELSTEQTETSVVIDMARPRNVERGIGDLSAFQVFDLDDLHEWMEEVRDRRGAAVPKAKAICEELLSDFVTWVFHQQALQPAIRAIRETFESIRKQEVDRHAHRTGMNREEVERLTRSILQKLLAVPIVRLKNVDPESIDFVQGIKLLHALFSPSDDDGGRTLETATSDGQPSLSDAPSPCPYLTHDPGEQTGRHDPLDEILQMAGADPEASASAEGPTDESEQDPSA